MTIIIWALPISTVLTTLALTVAYALEAAWSWALISLCAGVLWLAGQRYAWRWTMGFAMTLCVALSAIGILAGMNADLMLIALMAALTAWNLALLTWRLNDNEPCAGTHLLVRRHLQRLVSVDTLGLLLAGAALRLDITFGLGVAFLLGLIAVSGMSRAVGWLRRESD